MTTKFLNFLDKPLTKDNILSYTRGSMNCCECKSKLVLVKKFPSQKDERNDSFLAISICPTCYPEEAKTLKALEATHEDSGCCGFKFGLKLYNYSEQRG